MTTMMQGGGIIDDAGRGRAISYYVSNECLCPKSCILDPFDFLLFSCFIPDRVGACLRSGPAAATFFSTLADMMEDM